MRLSAQSATTAAGAVIIAVAVFIAVHHRTAPARIPTAEARSSERPIVLRVERQGEMLCLRWNPAAPEVMAAPQGVLIVRDGGRESRLPIETAELRAGTATYRPQAQDVTFRLQLAGGAAGEVHVSGEPRPSPFERERKPVPASHEGAAPLRRQPVEESDEEPPPTYTNYWKLPAAHPVEGKGEPSRTPAAAPAQTSPGPGGFAERAAAPSRSELARHQDAVAPEAAEPAGKPSGLGRVVHKIPFLRRLQKEH
jgi:hypothetical protein